MRPPRLRPLAAVVVAAAIVSVAPLVATDAWAGAPPSTKFTCVVKSANACVVTIDVTSNMSEQVGSTMPDRKHPWYLHHLGGPTGKGGYTLSGPGAPQTYWDGKSMGTQGYVWSALLTSGTVSAGDQAVLTFDHVAAARARHYRSFNFSYSSRVYTGGVVGITATVVPRPAKGHLLVQRLDAKKWVNVVSCTYSTKKKEWTASFAWHYPKHATRTYRLLALAAPGLLSTASPSFRISTAG